MAEIKRVTLHPLKSDGTMDLNTNLYPKTLLDGIVNRDGEEVDIATQHELDEAIDNIEQEIQALPKGDVTEEELQTVISTLEGAISTKATQEDINIAIADKVTEVHLQEVKTDLKGQIGTKASQEDIDELWDELDNKLLEYYLRFYWDSDNNKILLESSVEDWMSNSESFYYRLMLISVNGSTPAICTVNKHISSNLIQIYIYCDEDFGTIYMYCNIKDGDWNIGDWNINLDRYFPPIYDGSIDFAPYLEISNGEVIGDNVINPQWVADFSIRAGILDYIPAKAWVGIEDALEPCTIYRKFSEDKDIIICIQTSKGEYKLTYQFESDPK